MMKNIFIIFIGIFVSTFVLANERDDIITQYKETAVMAKKACKSISGSIQNIMILGGVATVSSSIGTVSAGIATVAGFQKIEEDRKVLDFTLELENIEKMNEKQFLAWLERLGELQAMEKAVQAKKDRCDAKKRSETLGNIRTIGDFVAGGTSAISAGTTIGAVVSVNFDDLKKNMKDCEKYAKEISKIKTDLMGIDLSDPMIPEMDRIVSRCRNFNLENIDGVKTALTIAGIVSIAGTGTGIAGGIFSNTAVQLEKQGALGSISVNDTERVGTKEYNDAANILSAVTTATSLTSGLLSGIPLINLNKNLETAKSCESAF